MLRKYAPLVLTMILIACVLTLLPAVTYAEVPDAVAGQWVKYPGNPVLVPTPGSWDADYVTSPRVV